MGPVGYILSGLAKGANFRDTSSRAEAWWFAGFLAVAALYATHLDLAVWRGMVADYSVEPPVVGSSYQGNLAVSAWAVLTFGPSFAMACRRLRDAGLRTDRLALPAFLAAGLLVLAFLDPLGVERTRWNDEAPLFTAEGWAMLGAPGFGRILLNEVLVVLAPLAPWLLLGPSLAAPSCCRRTAREATAEPAS